MRSSSQTKRSAAGVVVPSGDLYQAGEHVGDLDAGEPFFSLRVDHDHCKAEAEVGDIGKRMTGVEGERREDREDLTGKEICQGLPFTGGSTSVMVRRWMPAAASCGWSSFQKQRAHFLEHARDALVNGVQLLQGDAAVGGEVGHVGQRSGP